MGDYRHSLETLHLDLRRVQVISDGRTCTFRDFGKLQYVFINIVFWTSLQKWTQYALDGDPW